MLIESTRRPCAVFAVIFLGSTLALAGSLPTLDSPDLYDLQYAGFELLDVEACNGIVHAIDNVVLPGLPVQ